MYREIILARELVIEAALRNINLYMCLKAAFYSSSAVILCAPEKKKCMYALGPSVG